MGFQLSDKARKTLFIITGIGVILLIAGFFTQKRFLFPEEVHDDYSLVVMSNYHGFSDAEESAKLEGDLQALKEEIKTSLGDGYTIIIEDVTHGECNHDHGHDGHNHDGGEPHEDHAPDHEADVHVDHVGHGAHHGPSLKWHILIEPKEGAHSGAGHDGGHGEHGNHDHDHEAVAHADHGHGHGESPAQMLAAKFKSGELALPDSGFRRFWSNLLVNGFFFFGIALGALFYLGLHYATESGWGVVLLRVFEGVSSALPLGMIVLFLVFLSAALGLNHIYPWMDTEAVEASRDHLIHGKSAYLNLPFFFIRILVYFATFFFFMKWFRKTSRKEDEEGGVEIHYSMYKRSAIFLVCFAVFSSTMAWDIIMSIDTHWFSTLFGWYSFSGIWLSGMIVVLMTTLYLKRKGALEFVNENHIHDLGKWVFAISFLWSYLWFSQFMLIWYSNIPEEVIYFNYRFDSYKYIFLGMFVINFVFPMVMLMSRDAKRSYGYLVTIGSIIFVGHWFDVFCMVMPGTLFEEWQYGMLEIGMFLTFLGGFLLLVFKGLSSAPLVQKNHPYLQESIHHEF